MTRTIPAAAATEAAKATGAFPRRILEVQFASGTKFYSTEALTSPVTAEGRIRNIGEISISAEPGKGAQVGSVEIELADEDLFFLTENETKPGIQYIDAFLYLWFEGTTWPGDRILDFGGILTAPMRWDEKTASFFVTMKGFEHKYDREIGLLATTDIFPDIDCSEVQNTLIPICYGNPVYRVPAIVIDRPGQATLSALLSVVPDTTLTINSSADDGSFTNTSSIALAVGYGQRWERITGSFANGSTSTFNITSRGSVLAEGTISGFFGSGGFQYILVPRADIPSVGTSRIGHPLFVKNSGSWTTVIVTHWSQQGSNQAIAIKGDLTLVTGDDYKIGALPGFIPIWPAGTPVHEIGTWKYAVNYLPSKSVDRVEARTQVETGGGDRKEIWLEINPVHYSVDNDDRTFNTALGRSASDPGLTTIQLSFTPKQLGIDDETVFVTLKGAVDVGAGCSPAGSFGDAAIENPADVIEHLLKTEILGDVPTDRINASSFTTAATKISTKCSFAILNSKARLSDIIGDIAFQAHSILFWDAGEATMIALERPLGTSDLTITRDDYTLNEMLQIEDYDVKNYITELEAKFRPAVPAGELILVRASSAAITDFGTRREEINFWAYQFPTSVALATEFWLEYFLETNRRVTFTTWLNAVKIQPGDVITLDIDDGAGNIIFNSVKSQVIGVRRQPGNLRNGSMEKITITCELKLYDYAISVAVPSDNTCIGNVEQRQFETSGQLFLQSSGSGRSLFVASGTKHVIDGGANIQKPIQLGSTEPDPNADYVLSIGLILESPGNPDCP